MKKFSIIMFGIFAINLASAQNTENTNPIKFKVVCKTGFNPSKSSYTPSSTGALIDAADDLNKGSGDMIEGDWINSKYVDIISVSAPSISTDHVFDGESKIQGASAAICVTVSYKELANKH